MDAQGTNGNGRSQAHGSAHGSHAHSGYGLTGVPLFSMPLVSDYLSPFDGRAGFYRHRLNATATGTARKTGLSVTITWEYGCLWERESGSLMMKGAKTDGVNLFLPWTWLFELSETPGPISAAGVKKDGRTFCVDVENRASREKEAGTMSFFLICYEDHWEVWLQHSAERPRTPGTVGTVDIVLPYAIVLEQLSESYGNEAVERLVTMVTGCPGKMEMSLLMQGIALLLGCVIG